MRGWLRLIGQAWNEVSTTWRQNAARNREGSRRARLLDHMIVCAETQLRTHAASSNGRAEAAVRLLRSLDELTQALVEAREDLWIGRPTPATVGTLRSFRSLVEYHEAITEKLDPLIALLDDEIMVESVDN